MADYFFIVTMLLGNKSYTVGKPVYFHFKWCHICKEHALMGLSALSMWVAPMKNLPNLLFQCQAAYSAAAIESCFEFLVSPDVDKSGNHWRQSNGESNRDKILQPVAIPYLHRSVWDRTQTIKITMLAPTEGFSSRIWE